MSISISNRVLTFPLIHHSLESRLAETNAVNIGQFELSFLGPKYESKKAYHTELTILSLENGGKGHYDETKIDTAS